MAEITPSDIAKQEAAISRLNQLSYYSKHFNIIPEYEERGKSKILFLHVVDNKTGELLDFKVADDGNFERLKSKWILDYENKFTPED